MKIKMNFHAYFKLIMKLAVSTQPKRYCSAFFCYNYDISFNIFN